MAILGDGAALRHAAVLAGADLADAAAAADRLPGIGVFAPGTPLRFVHSIVRTAVHHDIPEAARGLRHAEAARLLAAEGADADAVCAHLLVCEPAGSIEVVAQLRAAAARAAGRGATASAVAYLRRALAETADGACTRCCCTNWARHDVLNITVDPKTGKVSAWVTLDTAGGLLYGTLKVSRNPVTHGTVTDGTAPRHQKKPAGMGTAGRPAPAL